MSDVSPMSGISGLSFDSTSLSSLLFFCLVLLLFLSYLFFCLLAHLLNFFQKNHYFLFGVRLFCMAPVQQLGEVSWSVVCAACCHMALVLAVMHLYNQFFICFCPFLSFFFSFFFKSGIDKSTEWSTIPTCPTSSAFLTGAIPKGLILRNFCS